MPKSKCGTVTMYDEISLFWCCIVNKVGHLIFYHVLVSLSHIFVILKNILPTYCREHAEFPAFGADIFRFQAKKDLALWSRYGRRPAN